MKRKGMLLAGLAFIVVGSIASAVSYGSAPNGSASNGSASNESTSNENAVYEETGAVGDIPEYSGSASIVINENVPYFKQDELESTSFASYSELDSLNRCGVAYACVSQDTMPTQARGNIREIKPSGWHTVKYDILEDLYLYNRCHLIAFSLTGENDNPQNLITGTRYMNVQGMLPYEIRVSDYVRSSGNHVLYRVTPVFHQDDLVASGVLMEAESVEDEGAGICFNVYCYNVEPGIVIDYATGDSALATPQETEGTARDENNQTYIVNTNTGKFHYPDCPGVSDIRDYNKKECTTSRDELIRQGYEPCGMCSP